MLTPVAVQFRLSYFFGFHSRASRCASAIWAGSKEWADKDTSIDMEKLPPERRKRPKRRSVFGVLASLSMLSLRQRRYGFW